MEQKKIDLVQITIWLPNGDIDWLISEQKRIRNNKTRTAKIVQKNSRYALFANDVRDVSKV